MSLRRRSMPKHLPRWLLGGTVLLSSPLPWPLMAAETTQDASASNDDKTPSDTKPDATKAKLLGNVTVTAQSRTQEMEQVPIPLQIITSKEIDTLAATDLSKMSLFVPGLVVGGEQPTQPSYQLRGVSSNGFGIGTEPSVGVYVDGVYAARSGGALLAFNDIARIEVLKGPQGTLFGRNAAAGAISIVTNEPSDKLEGKVRLRLGNYGTRYGDALLNLPINSTMALRVSVLDNQSHGWVKDADSGAHYGKNDDWGSRIAWRWNVTPDTRVLLTWDHERLNQPPRPAFSLIDRASYRQIADYPGYTGAPFPADDTTYLNPLHAPLTNGSSDAAETRTFNGATLAIDHSFSWGSLTSTTAWRGFDTFNRGDYDGTASIGTYLDTANIEHNGSWYQEFKLAGNTDLADWVAGASWYDEQARQVSQTNVYTDSIDTLALDTGTATGTPDGTIYHYFDSLLQAFGLPYHLLGDSWREQIQNHGHFKAYAAFGDVIWHLNDRLDLTTGLRFTRDVKDFSWYNPPRSAPALDSTLDELDQAGLLDVAAALSGTTKQALRASLSSNLIFTADTGAPVGVLVNRHASWNNVSPRVVLDYKFTPDIMGYASVTKGYKAGGFDFQQFNSQYAPEKVLNFEGGIKSMFPEQNLMLNGSVYYYRYNNKQSLTLVPTSATTVIPQYEVQSTNQKAKGLDLELEWLPIDALRLNATLAYIDSTYRHALASSGVNISGQPTGEPRYSFTAGLAYTWQNVAHGTLQFELNHAYRGRSRCNRDSILQGECEVSPNFDVGAAQQRTDARLDWHAAGDRWGVALFGNNIFDKRYVTGISNITTSVFGTPYASITPPRTWGVELRAAF